LDLRLRKDERDFPSAGISQSHWDTTLSRVLAKVDYLTALLKNLSADVTPLGE
jgi:hypothetical protein